MGPSQCGSCNKSSINNCLSSSTHVQSCSRLPPGLPAAPLHLSSPQASPGLGLPFVLPALCLHLRFPGLSPSPTPAVLGWAGKDSFLVTSVGPQVKSYRACKLPLPHACFSKCQLAVSQEHGSRKCEMGEDALAIWPTPFCNQKVC